MEGAINMGTVLFPGLGPGLGSTINPFDPQYEAKLLLANRQASVESANAKLAATYISHANQIKEANVGQQTNHQPLLTIDPPPHKWVLDANGNQVQSTELVTAAISVVPDPPAPTPGQAAPGQIVSTNVPMDREDMILLKLDRQASMLLAIAQKLGMS